MSIPKLLYIGLCIFWLVVAGLILAGYHERFLGQAEPWKQYLGVSLCLLMMLLNIHRLMKLQLKEAKARSDVQQ
jgi:hypothetical protein